MPRASRPTKRERDIWQSRYWEHLFRQECVFERHIDYIHDYLVKHGNIKRPSYLPFSTFHRYDQSGVLQENSANDLALEDFTGGEQ
ncbi:MAG: hypothetical protein PHF31_13545 [Methylobacter sp.]|nr:hypothetical protein [Methylobacter sp.]